jgi:hypothetical protein
MMLFVALLLALTGCRSAHIETVIENRTGKPVRLLEVDYPSASYGTDSIPAGGEYHYRLQIQGSGPIKVEYTSQAGRQIQLTGPSLAQGQDGRLDIVLLPGDRAEFHPQLSSRP